MAVCTTCVVETIGDDVPMLLKQVAEDAADSGMGLPPMIHCSTPLMP